MEQLSGTMIKGYELRDRIGAGGFGAVYRAFQSTVGREVAIKIILPGFANRPEFVRRFEAEAQTIARLEHMNITPLYDYWRDPEGAYLVMRYLRGGSLLTALQDNAYDLESAALLLDQVASALAVAHRNHIIHRDIKPANILLDEDGNGYVADFGLAKDLDNGAVAISQPGDVVGTPDYLSPEQVRNESVTPRSDIYSLGLVLYEMLTGSHPFPESSPVERMFKQLNEPLPRIASLDQNVAEAINEVIQKATAKNPDQRYQDVLALATAFREAAGLSVSQAGDKLVELLTPREQEVLKLIIEGKSNREIANKLTIELTTVKWYVTQIYHKLNVRSRVQAIVRARELDLIVDGAAAADSTVSGISALPEPENPYKGLQAFQIADEQDFFGREKLTRKLLSRLDQSGEFSRFLAVIGPSGSGKSSLVRAGLIPALWRGDLSGSERWYITDLVPGVHPLDELEVALIQVAANRPENLGEQLTRNERGLVRAAQIILPDDDSELVIVIDQFEEVFTLVEHETDRTHFLELLQHAVTAPRSRVRLVITLRADFYDRPLQYPDFGELVRSRMETVLPLNAGELEQAIVGPAQRVGVRFEDGLVAAIVSDINYQPGALPLLQFALTELFEVRENRTLTKQGYEQIGRAAGALAKRAEQLYLELDETGREAVRQMFLRLVTLGEGSDDTRRRVARSELLAIAQDADLMDEVIDTFAAYRLLALDHDPGTRSPTVEVAHEAILREWERLRQWLNESRADIRLQRILAAAAQEWLQAERDPGFLLRGARLDQFEGWTASTDVALTKNEQTFLEASLAARQARRAEEEARLQREARLEQRSRNFLRSLVAVFAVAAIISAGLGLYAFQQRQVALDNAAEAQNVALVAGSQAALAKDDTDTALTLAWQAVNLSPDSALAQVQLSEAAYAPGTVRLFVGHTDSVTSVAISPDEKTMLSTSWDGVLMLWDIETGEILRQFEGHTNAINDVDFSADGRVAVSGSEDKTAILWDVQTGQIIRRFDSYNAAIVAVEFSPDGKSIVAAGWNDDLPMIRWDIAMGQVIQRYEGNATGMQGLEFTPDGSAILSGSNDGILILWDAHTGQIIYQIDTGLDEGSGSLREIVISPDGLTAISGIENSEVLLWDLSIGELIRRYSVDGGAQTVAFHPNDGSVFVGTGTSTLIHLDLETGEILNTFTGHNEVIMDVEIIANGRYAISASADKTLRLWELNQGQVIRRFSAPDALLFEVDISPDGRTALSGSTDGTVTLWDVETGEMIHRFTDDQPVMAVTYSPDGNTALTGGGYRFAQKVESGHIILWDMETGQEIRRFEGQPYVVYDVEFSPDGKRAVSSGNGAMVILWDVETGQELRRFEDYFVDSPWPIESFWDVEFSPDGSTILAAYSKGPLILWDVETGEEINQLVGHVDAGATGITFSANGQRVVSGGWDTQAILWSMESGRIIRRFTNHVGPIGQIDFTPDEQLMLGGSGDGATTLWDVETGEVIRRYNKGFVMKSVVNADGSEALVGFHDGAVELWRIDATLDELLEWTQANRYIPELTCEQRELYRLEPWCESEE
jgi:WD40 repeat protein/serine/threonine protein kinase